MFLSALCGSQGLASGTSGSAEPVGGGIFAVLLLLELSPGVPGSLVVSIPRCHDGPVSGPSIGPESPGSESGSAGAGFGAGLADGLVFLGMVGPIGVGPASWDDVCARQTPASSTMANRYFMLLF